MSDEANATILDRNLINLNERYEVRDWTNSLGVNEVELREAVAAVGTSGDEVRKYLASQ